MRYRDRPRCWLWLFLPWALLLVPPSIRAWTVPADYQTRLWSQGSSVPTVIRVSPWHRATARRRSMMLDSTEKDPPARPIRTEAAPRPQPYENLVTTEDETDRNATAERLFERAQQLRQEAQDLERALEQSRRSQRQEQESTARALYDKLFLRYNYKPTALDLCHTFEKDRWSMEQALQVLELLYTDLRQQRREANQNATALATNTAAVAVLEERLELLLSAARIRDERSTSDAGAESSHRWSGRGATILQARWRELERGDQLAMQQDLRTWAMVGRHLIANESMAASLANTSKEMATVLSSKLWNDLGRAQNFEAATVQPSWLPSTILPYLHATRNATLDERDIHCIKERVLPGSGFVVTSSDSIPTAAVFRGELRPPMSSAGQPDDANNPPLPSAIFAELQRRMKTERLSDRVQLFLLEDLGTPTAATRGRPAASAPTVMVLAIHKNVQPDDRLLRPKGNAKGTVRTSIRRISAALTLLTTVGYSVSCFALNPSFFKSIVLQYQVRALVRCLPIVFGVLAVHVAGETARRFMARHRNIQLGPPIPLPSSHLGCFGCMVSLRSFPDNRATMMEVALASPLTGLFLSTLLVMLGTVLSLGASEAAITSFPCIPAAMIRSSLWVSSIVTYLAPKLLMLPLPQPVPLHPLFVVGFAGLVTSALNMLPIFRLDGGRACTAALGNRAGAFVSVSAIMTLLSVSMSSDYGLGLAWCMIIALFRRSFDIPAREEVSPVDKGRLGVWVSGLLITLLVLLPFPGGSSFL